MARRRSSRRRYDQRTSRKIEHRQWFTTTEIQTSTVTFKQGSDTDNVVKLAVDNLKGDDQTILRTRGQIAISTSTLGADTMFVLGGIVLPNKTAANAGTTDLPSPLVDSDTTDWFVWHPFMVEGNVADSGSETPEDAVLRQTMMLDVDSKAKRIMEASESVVWILGGSPENAISSKTFKSMLNIRTLVGY